MLKIHHQYIDDRSLCGGNMSLTSTSSHPSSSCIVCILSQRNEDDHEDGDDDHEDGDDGDDLPLYL